MLREKDLAAISRLSEVAPKAIMRLVGALRVASRPQTVQSSEDSTARGGGGLAAEAKLGRDIGLRLEDLLRRNTPARDELLAVLSEVFREYRNSCPKIVEWVGRGDFQAAKIPESVSPAAVLHASRTAGRLRAKLLRGAGSLNAGSD